MTTDDVIAAVVENVAGHDVVPLIAVLKDKKNVSEFILAEELKEEINTVRNKLYRLYDSSLVEFIRKKDKKKGWYIYYWTFVPSRIPKILENLKKKKLEKLKERLKSEQSADFFECINKCMRLTFEKAIDFEFKCPECGSLMNQEDNSKKIKHMFEEVELLEKEAASEPKIIEENIEIDEIENPRAIVKKEVKINNVKISKTKKNLKKKKS